MINLIEGWPCEAAGPLWQVVSSIGHEKPSERILMLMDEAGRFRAVFDPSEEEWQKCQGADLDAPVLWEATERVKIIPDSPAKK